MYQLSTDYPALYELLLKGEEVACWVIDTNQNRRILSAKLQDGFIWLAAVEVTYRQLPSDTDYFTSVCEAVNLSYIPPSRDIAEKAWDAGCTKLLADISARFNENVKNADTIQDMAVFQAIADTMQKFPIPSKTDYLNSL